MLYHNPLYSPKASLSGVYGNFMPCLSIKTSELLQFYGSLSTKVSSQDILDCLLRRFQFGGRAMKKTKLLLGCHGLKFFVFQRLKEFQWCRIEKALKALFLKNPNCKNTKDCLKGQRF